MDFPSPDPTSQLSKFGGFQENAQPELSSTSQRSPEVLSTSHDALSMAPIPAIQAVPPAEKLTLSDLDSNVPLPDPIAQPTNTSSMSITPTYAPAIAIVPSRAEVWRSMPGGGNAHLQSSLPPLATSSSAEPLPLGGAGLKHLESREPGSSDMAALLDQTNRTETSETSGMQSRHHSFCRMLTCLT